MRRFSTGFEHLPTGSIPNPIIPGLSYNQHDSAVMISTIASSGSRGLNFNSPWWHFFRLNFNTGDYGHAGCLMFRFTSVYTTVITSDSNTYKAASGLHFRIEPGSVSVRDGSTVLATTSYPGLAAHTWYNLKWIISDNLLKISVNGNTVEYEGTGLISQWGVNTRWRAGTGIHRMSGTSTIDDIAINDLESLENTENITWPGEVRHVRAESSTGTVTYNQFTPIGGTTALENLVDQDPATKAAAVLPGQKQSISLTEAPAGFDYDEITCVNMRMTGVQRLTTNDLELRGGIIEDGDEKTALTGPQPDNTVRTMFTSNTVENITKSDYEAGKLEALITS